MSTGSQSATDTSKLIQPIELASSTIIQLLDARTNATTEVLDYLEQECDALLECRLCQSMFRSLANFIAHKRVYCLRSFKDEQAKRKYYVNPSVPFVEPADADVVKIPRRSTAASRRTWRGRKAKPVRKTVPADLSKIKERPAVDVVIKPIEGVSCALSQSVAGSEVDGRSSATGSNSDKSEVITTVEPKDGYPNMNLRQRSGKSTLALGLVEWEDVEDDVAKALQKSKSLSSKIALAEVLSKRTDCDFTKLKCLTCNATFSTAKTLNFHMLNKHGKKRNLYPCIYCKNVFTQFWGVTRHLKTAHNLSGDAIDKAREMIRSRVYSESLNSEAEKEDEPTTTELTSSTEQKPVINSSPPRIAKSSLICNLCSKVFGKRQYLYLHMVACYKKAGLEPPPFKKPETVEEKAPKPLLFVCKTCNRAFSARQNMVMHAVACGKRRKDLNASTDVKQDNTNSDTSPNDTSALDTQQESKTDIFTDSPKEGSSSSNDSNESPESAPPKKASPAKFDQDDILLQLSPSDEAKEEERNQTPPVTPTSLALSRPKRNLKPKQFSDGTVSVRRKVPEVVRVQQADGSQVYKLRQDVEVVTTTAVPIPPLTQIIQPETEVKTECKIVPLETMVEEAVDIVKAKDTKGMRILIQGESVPLLDEEDEAKIAGMVDMSKLLCLKCKRQYGSSSNLRRHAVRHLGWRRYKCKLCKFTSYNKSECKSHLRKCHHNDVATLLDGGLGPFIIDLGALLDETEEGNGKLNISVPSTSENGGATPTSCLTRARSKEPVAVESQAPAEEPPKAGGRRKSGRAKKQSTDASSDGKITPTMPENSNKSLPSSGNSDKGAEATVGRSRGRARKQELRVMSEAMVTSQDENNKRSHSTISGGGSENGPSEPSQAKLVKVVDVSEKGEAVKTKETSAKLEGLVNKLKSIRKPLAGAEDNSKTVKLEVAASSTPTDDNAASASPMSPPLNIPTTISEVVTGDN